jgi:NAD(P)-dependent dehydrogenase (short-subunit alcohol dehydrogenase family)
VDGFTSMLATKLTGVFLAARAAVPVMKRQRRGTILAVSSMAGFVAYLATDGGNLARTSIIFPGDLGGDMGVLPDALAQDIA